MIRFSSLIPGSPVFLVWKFKPNTGLLALCYDFHVVLAFSYTHAYMHTLPMCMHIHIYMTIADTNQFSRGTLRMCCILIQEYGT